MLKLFLFALVTTVVCQAQTPSKAAPKKKEQTFSIDYADMEIRTLLRDVADRFDLNLVIPDTLQGTTSIKLRDVNWRQTFDVVLKPIGYTFVEEGDVVKVVTIEDSRDQNLMAKRGMASDDWLDGPWYFAGAIGAFVLITVICHVSFFIGVLLDMPTGGTRFAPKFIWALVVLLGGVIPVVGYWIIHHSNLRRMDQSPV
jgi:type II secretory pathway component GspD/PulD (secretin)